MSNNDDNQPQDQMENPRASSKDLQPYPFKLYFFFFYSAVGSSYPFQPLYFKQLGLSPGHTGVIIGLRFATEFIGAPLWGIIGDKFKIRKLILFASLFSFAVGTMLFLVVQPHNQLCIEVTANETSVKPLLFTSGEITLGPELPQHVLMSKNTSSVFTRENDETEVNRIFFIFLAVMLLGQILGCDVFTMPDAILVGALEDKTNTYGYIRVWGEIGVAMGSLIVGIMISFHQSKVCGLIVKNYFISFYFFAGFIAAAMLTVVIIKVSYPEEKGKPARTSYSLVVRKFLEPLNCVFLLCACVFGIFDSFHQNFGLWFLDDLGAKPYMVGLAAGLRYTAALVGYVSSSYLTDLFDIDRPIAFCLLLYSVLFIGISFTHQAWIGVILFSVQGVLYGLGWSCCVVFGGKISKEVGFYAAVQGIVGGCFWGLGGGAGTLLSGLVVNVIGIAKMYFVYSLTSAVMFTVVLIAYCRNRQKEDKKETENEYKLLSTTDVPEN